MVKPFLGENGPIQINLRLNVYARWPTKNIYFVLTLGSAFWGFTEEELCLNISGIELARVSRPCLTAQEDAVPAGGNWESRAAHVV